MTKSKSQTNSEILSEAKKADNLVSQIPIRHVNSQHPKDCLCKVCNPLRFSPNDSQAELKEKIKNDYYLGE
jgi:hypothetical protein